MTLKRAKVELALRQMPKSRSMNPRSRHTDQSDGAQSESSAPYGRQEVRFWVRHRAVCTEHGRNVDVRLSRVPTWIAVVIHSTPAYAKSR